jgi:hypothetical protein
MTNQSITWTLTGERSEELRSNKVLAIGIEVTYPGRECGLSIQLETPAEGSLPEREFALDELRRLHGALTHILAEE